MAVASHGNHSREDLAAHDESWMGTHNQSVQQTSGDSHGRQKKGNAGVLLHRHSPVDNRVSEMKYDKKAHTAVEFEVEIGSLHLPNLCTPLVVDVDRPVQNLMTRGMNYLLKR